MSVSECHIISIEFEKCHFRRRTRPAAELSGPVGRQTDRQCSSSVFSGECNSSPHFTTLQENWTEPNTTAQLNAVTVWNEKFDQSQQQHQQKTTTESGDDVQKTTIHTKKANQNNSGRKSACATRQRAQFAIQLHSCTLSYVLGIVYRLSFSVFCSSVRRSFVRSLSLRPLITTQRFVTSRHIMSQRVSFAKVARQICWVRNVFLIISEEAKILNYFSVDYISLFDFVASALLYKSKVRT